MADGTEEIKNPFFNIELENKVLRHLIIDERAEPKLNSEVEKNLEYLISLGLEPDSFITPFCRLVFTETISSFVRLAVPLTREIFLNNLKKRTSVHLEQKSQMILFDKILKESFSSQSFKHFAEELKNLYNYRKLFDITYTLYTKLNDHKEKKKSDPLDIAKYANNEISKILLVNDRARVIEQDIFHDVEKDIADFRERREHPEKYKGIPTGFERIDIATGGWMPGELSIVLGRPGMGKSVLLLNFAYYAYSIRYNVFYVTIEMPLEQQKKRLYSRITDTKYNLIKMPDRMADSELELFEKRLRKERESRKNFLWFLDAPSNCNASFLDSRITAFENTIGEKIDLLVVDPIYLMKPVDTKTDDPVGAISWDLKLLSRKLNIPTIVASQFNRAGGARHQQGKSADTMDAAFSDKLGNNSDNMIAITGDKKFAKLSFPKTRDSNVQDIYLEKEFEYMRFKYNPDETEDSE
jgi:replicative DNA helicase